MNKCRNGHDFSRQFGNNDVQLEFGDAGRCRRCDIPRHAVQSPEYMAALRELNQIAEDVVGCSIGEHDWVIVPNSDGWWRCSRCEVREQEVELERFNILEGRRWRDPRGHITYQAINHEAVNLLKEDPEEYFRLSDELREHKTRQRLESLDEIVCRDKKRRK